MMILQPLSTYGEAGNSEIIADCGSALESSLDVPSLWPAVGRQLRDSEQVAD